MRRSSTNKHPRAAEFDEPMTNNSRLNYPQFQLPKRETESTTAPESETTDVIIQKEFVYFHKRQHSRKLLLKKQKGV